MENCKSCIFWAGESGQLTLARCLHPKVGRAPSLGLPDCVGTLFHDSVPLMGPDYGCIHHTPKDCRELDAMRVRDAARQIPTAGDYA